MKGKHIEQIPDELGERSVTVAEESEEYASFVDALTDYDESLSVERRSQVKPFRMPLKDDSANIGVTFGLEDGRDDTLGQVLIWVDPESGVVTIGRATIETLDGEKRTGGIRLQYDHDERTITTSEWQCSV